MKQNKIPMRRCIGCMESKPKRDLVRIVASEEEGLKIDPSGKANGRGAYLCPNPECVEKAKKKKAEKKSDKTKKGSTKDKVTKKGQE